MRINVAVPEANVKKPVLDAALEAVTRLNEDMIRNGQSPTSDALISAGAIWKPEPPGQEHFDHGALIGRRGHGDCDDWAPLHAATLRVTGEDPEARAVVKKSGPKRWHAVVERHDGSIDDPSLAAGMPGPGSRIHGPGGVEQLHGIHGAWVPPMFRARRTAVHGVNGEVGSFINMPQLALRPVSNREGQVEAWQARADLPWHWQPGASPSDIAMVSLHRSPVSDQAVAGAVRGAFRLGLSGGADPEQLKRLSAIEDCCNGASWEELAHMYGPDHATAAGAIVGGFFGKAFRAIKKVAKKAAGPVLKGALSFVPGGGLASTALSMASPLLKKNVARARHAPPQLRPAMLARPPRATPLPRPAAAPAGRREPMIVQHFHGFAPNWSGGAPGQAWPPVR